MSEISGEAVGTVVETIVTVTNKNGLHARPSSVLAESALRFEDTTVRIRRGDLEVDAKSIMELLLLEASKGTELTVLTDGPQAQAAAAAMAKLFADGFGIDS